MRKKNTAADITTRKARYALGGGRRKKGKSKTGKGGETYEKFWFHLWGRVKPSERPDEATDTGRGWKNGMNGGKETVRWCRYGENLRGIVDSESVKNRSIGLRRIWITRDSESWWIEEENDEAGGEGERGRAAKTVNWRGKTTRSPDLTRHQKYINTNNKYKGAHSLN